MSPPTIWLIVLPHWKGRNYPPRHGIVTAHLIFSLGELTPNPKRRIRAQSAAEHESGSSVINSNWRVWALLNWERV